jgi:predicted DNA-binding protein (MmcQ/YjbR family)
MPYTCPQCERPLTKKNSWHYCKRTTIDSLFEGKPPELKALFDKLLAVVGSWEGVAASASKTCIVFITTKTFLVVKVMKRELDLKFALPQDYNEFPVYKIANYGNKTEHYIRLSSEEELDAEVFGMIRQSYELMQ